jgi:hypothetical protein
MSRSAADDRPYRGAVLQRIELDHFKTFERFTLYLRGDAYLAGPKEGVRNQP